MTNIKVVIGANYGDEGKGLMTDYFCANAKGSCIVVLSNGGAQRGHTVTTPDGERHVFKHFGAGTLAGADTYCPEDFILNPMTFVQELEQLRCSPRLFVHPRCKWSTPYDMFINQIVEEVRDHKRHGSCGMGIWETICRYEAKPCIFNIFDFAAMNKDAQIDFLTNIRDTYMMQRLKEYGIKSVPSEWYDIVYSRQLMLNFVDDVRRMVLYASQASYAVLRYYDNVVFENGQGLLLDQKYGDNATPSNTGIANPLKVLNRTFDKADLEVCYVSRTYITRHGAGNFTTESSEFQHLVDDTNHTNQFQGELRYGELVVDDLNKRVEDDLRHLSGSKFNWRSSLAVTHTNEAQFDYSALRSPIIYTSNERHRNSVEVLT